MRTRPLLIASLFALAACRREGPQGSGNAANPAAVTPTTATSAATPQGPSPSDGPEAITKRYLELGARGDLDGARALVVEDCRSGPLGEVDATKMMGARMTVARTETSVESLQGDDARVRYTLQGAVHSDGGTTEVLGARVHMNGINIEDARLGGTLHLVRQAGAWRVTCH